MTGMHFYFACRHFVCFFSLVVVTNADVELDGAEVDHTTRIASRRKDNRVLERREGRVVIAPGAIRAIRALLDQPRNSTSPCAGSMLRRQRRLSGEVCVLSYMLLLGSAEHELTVGFP